MLFIDIDAISAIVLVVPISTIFDFSKISMLNVSPSINIDNLGIFISEEEFFTDKFSIFKILENNPKSLKSYVILISSPSSDFIASSALDSS